MRRFSLFFLIFLLFSSNFTKAFAQNWDIQTIEWYNDMRIKLADKTSDNYIELMEIVQAKDLFIFYKNQENFVKADENNSQNLDKRELMQSFQEEQKYLIQYWQNKLDKLLQKFTPAQLKDIEYLKKNTGLLKQLVENNLWLQTNDKIVEQIFEDTDWINTHKIVVRSLSNNFYYFVSKPQKALNWYKQTSMKQGSKNFMLFRQLHIRYLSTNQQFKKTL